MNRLLRAGAMAAIAGGVLRIADSFAADMLGKGTLAMLYFLTDLLLLAGIAAYWTKRRASLGNAGKLGLAIFVVGILMVRASALGIGDYQSGAEISLLGLALTALETLIRRNGAVWAPLAWLAALAAAIAGAMGFAPAAMTALAGVAFGLGFVAAGLQALAPQSAQTATSTVT